MLNPQSLLRGAGEVPLDLDAAMFKWACILSAMGSRGEKGHNQDAQCTEVGAAHLPRLEVLAYSGLPLKLKDLNDQSMAFLREGRGVQASRSYERCPAMAGLHQS